MPLRGHLALSRDISLGGGAGELLGKASDAAKLPTMDRIPSILLPPPPTRPTTKNYPAQIPVMSGLRNPSVREKSHER